MSEPSQGASAAHALIDAYDARLGAQGRPPGVIYTPPALARSVVDWAMQHVPAGALPVVLEPGCGAGRLLVPLVEALWRRRPDVAAVLGALRAEEIDAAAADVAREAVALTLRGLGASVPWPLSPDPIRVVDTLDDTTREAVDLVVGNPPYVFGGAIDAERRARLVERFELARGAQLDLFRLFVEATLSRVRPGGVHGLIMPDAVLARDELGDVRRWMLKRASLLGVGRCGAVFRAPLEHGRSRSVAMGVAVVLMQRSGMLTPYTSTEQIINSFGGEDQVSLKRRERPAIVRGWEKDKGCFGPPRPLSSAAVPEDGSPWQVAAPSWWFGEDGLKATLERSGVQADSTLRPGIAGATRGEELGRRGLHEGVEGGHLPVLTGREVMRMQVVPARHGLEPSRMRKPASIYTGPKVLVVKTGAAPAAAVDQGDALALQSLYVLHTEPASGWDAWALAAALSSAWIGAYAVCRWTAVKVVQPQLTLRNVRALPLPALDGDALARLSMLSRQLHADDVHAEERRTLERQVDAAVGLGFGLELDAWEGRLRDLLVALPKSQRSAWL